MDRDPSIIKFLDDEAGRSGFTVQDSALLSNWPIQSQQVGEPGVMAPPDDGGGNGVPALLNPVSDAGNRVNEEKAIIGDIILMQTSTPAGRARNFYHQDHQEAPRFRCG